MTQQNIGFSSYGNGQEFVIFMHDWLNNHEYYDQLRPYLNTATHKFVFIDLRGYGLSKAIYGGCSVEESANDVICLANTLKIDNFHIVGHAMSCQIAQYLPLEAQSRIKSISNICPIPPCGTQISEDALQHLETIVKGDLISAKALMQFLTQNKYHDWYYERKAIQWFSCSSPAARKAYLHTFCETNISSLVRGLNTPALTICGDYDAPMYSAEHMKQTLMQDFRNSQLVNLPCGHYPMEEIPIALAATLEKFWAAHM